MSLDGTGPSGYSVANEERSISTISIPPETIVVPDDYPTIQEAVNNASNGDTVYVRQGAYVENIIINKSISLAGENKSMTVIDGNGTGTTVTEKAFNASIEGFAITNGNDSRRGEESSWCRLQIFHGMQGCSSSRGLRDFLPMCHKRRIIMINLK